MKTALCVPFLLLGLACAQQSKPALPPRASLSEKLDRKLRDIQEEFQVPGMELGVIKDGKVVFAGACGVADLGTRQSLTPRSLFHMASVSKPFTATAVCQLVEEGKLHLDDKLAEALPYLKSGDPRFREITLRQVLAHTSGLPDVRDYEWDHPQADEGAAERYLRGFSSIELKAAPGERFRYSNLGYDILGQVIARASGMSFETYMKERVFKPIGMQDSTFLKAEVPANLAVAPHRRGIGTLFRLRPCNVYPYHRAHAPSSTLHSNAGEMLRFCQAWLEGGLVKKETRDVMWSRHADQGIRDELKAEWMGKVGLGWFLGSYKGNRMISFAGADPGFRSTVVLLPEKCIAVVCMGNADSLRVGLIARAAMDLALEQGTDT